MAEYYKTERTCEECGSEFWGTAGANFCSSACRSRRWRALRVQNSSRALAETCDQIARLSKLGSGSYSKLLIRLLRLTASELRRRGWDPAELLNGSPDDPVTGDDDAPGGVDADSSRRVKWVNSPPRELKMLEEAISKRERAGASTEWYVARRAALLAKLSGGGGTSR